MPQARFTKPFRYAEKGIRIIEYAADTDYPDVSEAALKAAREMGVLAEPPAPRVPRRVKRGDDAP